MLGLNLHDVVRGMMTAVHPDEDCVLYQSNGQVNNKGEITPVYLEPQDIQANIQPLDAQALKHLERVNDTKASEQIFVYSDESMPISGIQRMPILRNGDIIKRADSTYWLITSVIEDWSQDGWCNASITQQVEPPDFSASSWYQTGGGGT